jgi:hypothetical protein
MQEIQINRRKKSDKKKEKEQRFGKFSTKHIRVQNSKSDYKNKNNKK